MVRLSNSENFNLYLSQEEALMFAGYVQSASCIIISLNIINNRFETVVGTT